MAANKLCVSVEPSNSSMRPDNIVNRCDRLSSSELGVERPTLSHFEEHLLYLSDDNNNDIGKNSDDSVIRNEFDDNRFISSDGQTRSQSSVLNDQDRAALVNTDRVLISTKDGRTTGTSELRSTEESVSQLLVSNAEPKRQNVEEISDVTVNGNVGTSSVCRVEASVPLPDIVSEEAEVQQNNKDVPEYSDSDMEIDIDDDDDGTGYIFPDVLDDSEVPVGNDVPCEQEPSHDISAADEGSFYTSSYKLLIK